MLKTSPSLWPWKHLGWNVGKPCPSLKKLLFLTSLSWVDLDEGETLSLPRFRKSVHIKSNETTWPESSVLRTFYWTSEDSLFSPWPHQTIRPSSFAPGPSMWCHVLLETLLISENEQAPPLSWSSSCIWATNWTVKTRPYEQKVM